MGAKTYGLQMMTGTYCRHKGLHCGGMPRGTREKLKEKTLGSGEGRKSLDGYSVGEIIKAGKSSKRSAGSLRSFLLKARGGNRNPHLTQFRRVLTSARHARVKGLEMAAVSCLRTTFLLV